MKSKLFYTIKEFSDACGYTRQRIYQLIDFEHPRKSVIKVTKLGSYWFISRKEYKKWQKYAISKGEVKKYNFFPRVSNKELASK